MKRNKTNYFLIYLILAGSVVLKIFDAFTPNVKYGKVFYRYGLFQEEKQNFQKARYFYEKAIRYNPNIADAYYHLGLIYKRNNDLEMALSNFQMATYLVNPDANSYAELGFMLRDLGQSKRSLSAFKKSMNVSPFSPESHFNLGMAFLLDNQIEDALTEVGFVDRLGEPHLAQELKMAINNRSGLSVKFK